MGNRKRQTWKINVEVRNNYLAVKTSRTYVRLEMCFEAFGWGFPLNVNLKVSNVSKNAPEG